MNKDFELREWVVNLPCVVNRTVIVDVRGPWPILIMGLNARQVQTIGHVVDFVMEYVSENKRN